MPVLTKMRIVNIGHHKARIRDITLNFTDTQGRARHTVLRLRNGGGKTSIIRYLLSLIRPYKRDFIGRKGKSGEPPKLEDYVQKHDHSVVALEWELDAPKGQTPPRFLTIGFYEWRGTDLKRVFFSGRIDTQEPRLTIQGLPVYSPDRSARRNLAGFRSEWNDLKDAYPELGLASTEEFQEWFRILSDVGIDPELFHYQVVMNQKESDAGADTIFHFPNPAAFVDFLLELAHKPDLAGAAVNNIREFRTRLKERLESLQPERTLAEGLKQRLEPLGDTWRERRGVLDDAAAADWQLQGLRAHAEKWARESSEAAQQHAADAEASNEEARTAQAGAIEAQARSLALKVVAAIGRRDAAASRMKEKRREFEGAQEDERLLEVAVPFAEALHHEAEVERLNKELTDKQQEAAPLYDAVKKAAAAYYGSLANELKAETAAVKAADQQVQATRERIKATGTTIGDLKSDIREARGEADRLLGELRKAEDEMARLRKAGVLADGEDAHSALRRYEGELARARQSIQEKQVQIDILSQRLGANEDHLAQANARFAEERTAFEHAEAELERAAKAKEELERDPHLQRVLGTTDIDLDSTTAAAERQVGEAITRTTSDILKAQVELALDARTLQALRQTGRLPATVDVERVVQYLQEHLPAVKTGWAALDGVASEHDVEKRRRIVRAKPLIALGVVVRDEDYPRVQSLLAQMPTPPETLVAVASQSALLTEEETSYLIAGPRSDAYFDAAAGKRELENLSLLEGRREDKVNQLRRERSSLEEVRVALAAFRTNYPPGYFARRRQARDAKRAEVESLRMEQGRLTEVVRGLKSEIASARQRKDDLVRDEKERTLAEADLGRYWKDHGAHVEARKGRVKELNQTIGTYSLKLVNHQRELDAAEAQAARDEKEARERSAACTLKAQALAQVQHVAVPPPEPAPGPVHSHRMAYEQALQRYDGKVNQGGYTLWIAERTKDARKARERLALLLQQRGEIREPKQENVAKRLAALPDAHPEAVRTGWKRAVGVMESARGELGNITKEHQNLESVVARAEEAFDDLGTVFALKDEETHLEPGPADAAAEDAATQSAALTREADELAKRAEGQRKEAQQNERNHMAYLNETELVDALRTSLTPVLRRDWPRKDAPWQEPTSVDELKSQRAAVKKGIDAIMNGKVRLDKESEAKVRAIRTWIQRDEFKNLRAGILRKFEGFADQDLEERAEQLVSDLTVRVKTIDDVLRSVEQHRDVLVGQVLSVAEDGLALLRAAASQSKIPASVRGLGGANFLKIHTREPEETEARRDRIGQLVDSMTLEREIPTPEELAQKAVKTLCGHIDVKVLYPDAALGLEWQDITTLSKTSGGERLTSTLLLFSTLMQLRSKETRNAPGVRSRNMCILDNPIGTASRRTFIELQLAVAEAMGVQLIYATGVNDLEAVAPFPQIIQLKNEALDRKTGMRFMELDETEPTQIDATHLGRNGDAVPHEEEHAHATR